MPTHDSGFDEPDEFEDSGLGQSDPDDEDDEDDPDDEEDDVAIYD